MAVAVARVMGLDDHEETTILLGAYLHDVGMVRVPHEILGKNVELTESERRLLEMHPVWGVELLANVEFPWDIKDIIRWHHEHRDGTGYPDRLEGDAIPVTAQIVGLADFYDELNSTRALRPARTPADAFSEIRLRAAWWSPDVVSAFERVVGTGTSG
jgi:HD-GYP domain-containing protein (c-di-GMP phosphodiesterase class II)